MDNVYSKLKFWFVNEYEKKTNIESFVINENKKNFNDSYTILEKFAEFKGLFQCNNYCIVEF